MFAHCRNRVSPARLLVCSPARPSTHPHSNLLSVFLHCSLPIDPAACQPVHPPAAWPTRQVRQVRPFVPCTSPNPGRVAAVDTCIKHNGPLRATDACPRARGPPSLCTRHLPQRHGPHSRCCVRQLHRHHGTISEILQPTPIPFFSPTRPAHAIIVSITHFIQIL